MKTLVVVFTVLFSTVLWAAAPATQVVAAIFPESGRGRLQLDQAKRLGSNPGIHR
jgi:hypothetical protein